MIVKCGKYIYLCIYNYCKHVQQPQIHYNIEFNEHWINIRTYVCATYSVAVKIILIMAHYISQISVFINYHVLAT